MLATRTGGTRPADRPADLCPEPPRACFDAEGPYAGRALLPPRAIRTVRHCNLGGRQFDDYPEPQQRDFPPAYDPAIYGTRQQEQAPPILPRPSFDDPARAPHGEEAFEEDYGEERARRGLKIALVLAGLAIIGTGGVLRLSRVFGGAPSGPPPVIKANTTPSKIVAGRRAAEASNKQIYDRVGDASKAERVVPREEKPVEVKDSSRSPARMTSPSLPASSGTQEMAMKDNSRPPARATSSSYPASSGAQDMAMGASPPLNTDPGGPASAEPRKIRTVTIRPDQAGSNNGTGSIPAPRPRAPRLPHVPLPPRRLHPQWHRRQRRCRPRPAQPAECTAVAEPEVASADASARPAFPPPRGGPVARSTDPLGCRPTGRASDVRRLFGANLVSAQRVRGAGLLPQPAGQIPQSAGRPSADHPAGRSRQEGNLLPRPWWVPSPRSIRRRSFAAASNPPADSASSKEISGSAVDPCGGRGLIRGDASACLHHWIGRSSHHARRARVSHGSAAVGPHPLQA